MKARHGIHGHNANDGSATAAGWLHSSSIFREVLCQTIKHRLAFKLFEKPNITRIADCFDERHPTRSKESENSKFCGLHVQFTHFTGRLYCRQSDRKSLYREWWESKNFTACLWCCGQFFCAAVFCRKPKHDMNLKMCKCHNCFGGETNLSLHYLLGTTHFAMKLSAKWCLAENYSLAVDFGHNSNNCQHKGPYPAIHTPCCLLRVMKVRTFWETRCEWHKSRIVQAIMKKRLKKP